ncbi:MAG: hypothetical protein HC849_09730 [Oscillatoriales cyanobacterium RU_3_3]|nr:hypothetical protein [Oscillatoriales cyanobacterium RU_3_3]NJR26358.1 hypothetical protein [Richelia sp. CSU_2_1]
MNQPATKIKISVNLLIVGLSALAIFPAAVKAASSYVPAISNQEKPGILMSQRQQRIQFKRGASSAEVKGGILRGEVKIYLINANKGQTMNVEIQSVEGNAVFKVIDPNTNPLAEGQKSWSGELPQRGDYQIVVGSERGNAGYTLSVSIN